ncbi:MAG: PEPxxWA-CTERM sorting domain-containing protein [Phenylobacterium sp.]|nr:PEPxxWA-CTERM sorting domain-containing protein [Phenylobacterium sp.]
MYFNRSRTTRTGRHAAFAAAVSGLAMLAAPQAAQASGANVGSAAIITNRVCTAADTTCALRPKNVDNVYGGMGGGLNAAYNGMPGGSSAAAQVSFGEGFLPIVRLGSAAGAETRTGSSVTTFRSYTYEGDVAIDLAINGLLHYVNSFEDMSPGESIGEGLFYVHLAVVPIAAFSGLSPATTAGDIIFNPTFGFPDCSSGALGFNTFSSAGTSGDNTFNVGVSDACGGGAITINPGEAFGIVASMQAISNRGGFVDAMNTFTILYDEERTVISGTDTKVTAEYLYSTVNGAVPEPGTWALMIGGFGLVGAALRRSRVAAQI